MLIWLLTVFVIYQVLSWIRRQFKISGITQKYVLITGCDTGFGHLLAQKLDSMGFHVIAGCLTSEGIEKLKTKCSSRLHTVQLNVVHEESITKAVDHVKSLLPSDTGLWAVVNNAGVGGPIGYSECFTRQDYLDCLNVNLFGVIDVTKACLPLLRKARGRVVNIASMFGRISTPPAAYCISKYGVEAYSDCLRREVLHQGISVHILEPGFFKTDIVNTQDMISRMKRFFKQASSEFQDYCGPDYADKCADFLTEVTGSSNTDLSPVLDAYTHAVSAKYPKYRYLVGTDCRYIGRLLWNLPEWISDRVITSKLPQPRGTVTD